MLLRRRIHNDLSLQVQPPLEDIVLYVQMLLPVQGHSVQAEVVAGYSWHRNVEIDLQFVIPGGVHKQLLVHLQCHVGIELEHD